MKGSVVQRSPGSWTLRFDLGRDAEGKRKQKVITFRGTKREAERELTRLLNEINNGTFIEPSKLTVAEYLQQWLENYAKPNTSLKTYEGYHGFVEKHLAPALGSVLLHRLTPLQIQQYYTQKLANGRRDGKGGLSARTVLHHHRVLREALQQAVRWQMLARNPADAVEPPRPEDHEMSCLDEDETTLLLRGSIDTRLHIPVLMAVTTGLRRGEILGLRWSDVDMTEAKIAVRQAVVQTKAGLSFKPPKTQKGRRSVTLPTFVVAELRRHKGRQAQNKLTYGSRYLDHGLVVCQDNGEPISPNALTHAFTDLATHLGLEVTFHGLRHTHATYLLRRNVHAKIVSERLGHSNIGITLDTYSHVLPDMQEEAARHVDETFRTALAS